jgi:hypothetical protein
MVKSVGAALETVVQNGGRIIQPLLLALALGIGCRANGPVIGQTAGISTEVTLEVVSKRPPEVLIARDGSTCRVAPDVYARTVVGSMFRCRWSRT